MTASSPLPDGPYTAVATEPSTIGNPDGESETRTFEVFTHPPAVEFTKVPAERSKVTKPVFEGTTTAGETEPVFVHIHKGAEEVATLEATLVGRQMVGDGSAALPEGQYIAQATQASSIENGQGSSETAEFEIVTAVPKVTLQDTQVALEGHETDVPRDGQRSRDGDDPRPRRDHDERESGRDASTCPCPKPGNGQLIASTALADGLYTAVATEQSGVGNGTGESESRSFEVFTHPPAVEFTNVPAERSKRNQAVV